MIKDLSVTTIGRVLTCCDGTHVYISFKEDK